MRRTPPPRREEVPIAADVTGEELDRGIRREVASLGAVGSVVAQHLVMVGRLLDEDADLALKHAHAARRLGSRLACVREAVGLAAYRAGDYAQALAELRTVRRMTGSQAYLPILADCERGLGRPERALEYLSAPEARQLDDAGRIELLIVAAGARRDLGDIHASLITLQTPFLTRRVPADAVARLQVAYAQALDENGRGEESRTWLERAAALDPSGASGAQELLDDLDGLVFLDLEDDDTGLGDEAENGEVDAGDAGVVAVKDVEATPDRGVTRPATGGSMFLAPPADGEGPER
jgi:tetratricopeptide (TPR) repeat protein